MRAKLWAASCLRCATHPPVDTAALVFHGISSPNPLHACVLRDRNVFPASDRLSAQQLTGRALLRTNRRGRRQVAATQ